MAETPTREQLLEAHNAYLSVWLDGSEKAHREAIMDNDKLRGAILPFVGVIQQLSEEVKMLRARGCCREEPGG